MRIRTIKPEFWSNEHIARLPDFTVLLAIGLLNYADDEGYFNANPGLIKAALFPLREHSGSIPVAVTELSNQGFLELFAASDGRTYGRIVNFKKHQVINKPYPSKIKEFCTTPVGLLHLSGNGTGVLPYGTGIRDQGKGMDQGILPPAAKGEPRARNEVMDALAVVAGIPVAEIGTAVAKRLNAVITTIKQSSPDVTAAEVARRAENYHTHFQDAKITPEALGKHWGTCHEPALIPVEKVRGRPTWA